MKLGEVVVHMGTTTSSKSDEKQKNVFIILDRLMEVSSVKVPLRSC